MCIELVSLKAWGRETAAPANMEPHKAKGMGRSVSQVTVLGCVRNVVKKTTPFLAPNCYAHRGQQTTTNKEKPLHRHKFFLSEREKMIVSLTLAHLLAHCSKFMSGCHDPEVTLVLHFSIETKAHRRWNLQAGDQETRYCVYYPWQKSESVSEIKQLRLRVHSFLKMKSYHFKKINR